MHLSIVIPTFNRSGLLRTTIPALANQQTRAGVTYEVIFVSNGSSDQTEQVLKDAVAQHPGKFRYFCIAPTGGPSAPRNIGIQAATGEVVIILDDDVLPDTDLLLRHAEFHETHPEPNYAALGEVYVPAPLLEDPMSLFHTFPYDEVRSLERLSYLHFWTCHVSVKRDFMLHAGMFDESFLYYEDMICAHRLASHGMSLHLLSSARGQHLHQLQPSGVPSKGLFTGRWLYAFLQRVSDPAAKRRFGVLSPEIGIPLLCKRIVNRVGFRIVDNPATRGLLRLVGATRCRRNRLSDFYYFLIFRRNMLTGYYQAKRLARSGKHFTASTDDTVWANRGEG